MRPVNVLDFVKIHPISIDSMTVLTPVDSFNIIPISIYGKILEIDEYTGEILNTKRTSIRVERDGVKYKAHLVSLFGKHYIATIFNRKQFTKCGLSYFSVMDYVSFGILFPHVFNVLAFDVKPSEFLSSSLIYDVDFCLDFYFNDLPFSRFCLDIFQKGISKKFYSKPKHHLEEKRVVGIQFMTRGTSTLSAPFFKLYSKYDELVERSHEFKSDIPVMPTHRRCEVTIRNASHFSQLKIPNNLEILNLSNHEKYRVFYEILNQYSDVGKEPKITLKQPKENTPTEHLLVEMINVMLADGHTTENILGLTKKLQLSGNARSRLKTKLRQLLKVVKKPLPQPSLFEAFGHPIEG